MTTNMNGKFIKTTNMNGEYYAGAVSLDRSPSPGLQARTGWDTCPASLAHCFAPLQEKKYQAWRLGGPRTR